MTPARHAATPLTPESVGRGHVPVGGSLTIHRMTGKLPIDRLREATDAPRIHDEHREKFTQKQATLEQTNDLAEGEREPVAPDVDESDPPHEPAS